MPQQTTAHGSSQAAAALTSQALHFEMSEMSQPQKKITHYLIIAGLLQIVWGLVPSASKCVIDQIPVELYIAIRWTISGGIFAAYLTLTRSWQKVSLKTTLTVAVLGVLGYGFASFGTLYSLKIGGITNFALMGALSPAITTLIAITVLKERPSRVFFLALPVSIFGLLLLAYGKSQASSVHIALASCALAIFADILEAIVFVYSKKFKERMSAAQYLATTQIGAAIAMWALQASVFHQAGQVTQLNALGIASALFVSIVACVLCFAVLYWLLNHIDGHKLSLFEGFHVLSATAFGILFFHEELKPMMWIGGICILFGLVAGNIQTTRKRVVES